MSMSKSRNELRARLEDFVQVGGNGETFSRDVCAGSCIV